MWKEWGVFRGWLCATSFEVVGVSRKCSKDIKHIASSFSHPASDPATSILPISFLSPLSTLLATLVSLISLAEQLGE